MPAGAAAVAVAAVVAAAAAVAAADVASPASPPTAPFAAEGTPRDDMGKDCGATLSAALAVLANVVDITNGTNDAIKALLR